MKALLINEAEVVPTSDWTAIGAHAREGVDHVVGGVIAYPHHWAGFTISAPTSVQIAINPGRLFKGEMVYSADTITTINVQTYLPIIGGDTRWIALLARGEVNTINQSRLIETDAETEVAVLQSVPKVLSRDVEYVIQQGDAGPTPLKPAVAADQCCVAFILLGVTGIQQIAPSNPDRAKTLFEVEGRVTSVEQLLSDTRRRVGTLETDLSALAEKVKRIPRTETIQQIQRDVAATRRRLNFPEEARGYWYDPGLVRQQWDYSHASWLARVREGIRFSHANERDARIEVLDVANPQISIVEDFLLPAYSEVARISVLADGDVPDGFKNISSQVHTIVDAVQRTVSRSSVEYGPTVAVCENQQEWATVGEYRAGEIFSHAGETFNLVGVITDPNAAVDTSVINTWNPSATVADIAAWNSDPNNAGHLNYAVQQVIYNDWSETYWEYITTNFSVNGSVYAQSFLCASPMIMTSIELFFTRIGTGDGDVHLAICELHPTGTPDFSKVLSHTKVDFDDLENGWVKFNFKPVLLEQGKRYAFFTTTTGNHALGFVGNNNPDNAEANKYAQGTLFWATDGVWAQGQPGEDFIFKINCAQFQQTRTVVEFTPMTLENGMTEFRLIYPGWQPAGTAFVWEIKPSGSDEWTMLVPKTDNPLTGLPPLVQLRATFIGTSDLMPMIEVSAKARYLTARHRSTMVAVSKAATFGFETDTVQIETVVDNFLADHHTLTNKLIVGASVYTASATSVTVDFTKPKRRTYRSTFTVPSNTTSARLRLEMTTDEVTLIPFIQNAAMYAI